MHVGVLTLSLHIVGARSLKDKRSVVRSFRERVHARFKVSIAEVGELDDPRRATLGVAVVSNEVTFCDQVLAQVAAAAAMLPDAVLEQRRSEIVPFGPGGRTIAEDHATGVPTIASQSGSLDAAPEAGAASPQPLEDGAWDPPLDHDSGVLAFAGGARRTYEHTSKGSGRRGRSRRTSK